MSDVVRRLTQPEQHLSLEELAQIWFSVRIAARVPGYARLAHDLVLLRRIRGAVGQVLLEGASPEAIAGLPCPRDPPCALDVLFREQGRAGPDGIPKPYVLAAEPRGSDLVVSMTIFGFAGDWSAVAAHALAVALQHRIDWRRQRTDLFLPLPHVSQVIVRGSEGVRPLPGGRSLDIQFLTPMNAENDDPIERPATVFARLARRVEGLARWHDAAVADDWRHLGDLWRSAYYDTALLRRRRVERRSGRGRQDFQVDVVEGSLGMHDPPPALRPLLAIGQHVHVGKGANEGFGRFLIN